MACKDSRSRSYLKQSVHVNIAMVEARFLCAHVWSSSEGRVWAALIQQQGKGPAMVAMVNMAPCRVLPVPSSPSSTLSVPLLSTIHLHACFLPLPPSLPPYLHPNSKFIPSFYHSPYILSSFPSPPPVFPSRHSGLPDRPWTLHRTRRPSTHHGRLTGLSSGQQRDTTHHTTLMTRNHNVSHVVWCDVTAGCGVHHSSSLPGCQHEHILQS